MTSNKEISVAKELGIPQLKGFSLMVFICLCCAWASFQIWYSSPIPFFLGFGIFNDTEARTIHLTFSVILSFLGFRCFNKQKVAQPPIFDWFFALIGGGAVFYIYVFYKGLAERSGAPTLPDIVTALLGLILMLEAARRAIGPALVVVAVVFLLYALGGAYMPSIIAHKGASLNKLLSHQWLSTEGVFGIALGVSTNFVFMFVLFGALLEKTGAGNYFTKAAFFFVGHMRGGPAKAAVVASGFSGLISGSSIANVVTTGNFTIPLMKKAGFPSHKAGAIEVAASTNGQLTPPVMGAAAFLMVEYVNISYLEVIKHAILPALISYIALIYIVHLEAVKAGMQGKKRTNPPRLIVSLLSFSFTVICLGIITLVVYYGIGWLKILFPQGAIFFIITSLLLSYIFLVYYASLVPNEDTQDFQKLNSLSKTSLRTGLYFLLPIVILLWFITVERFSPSLSIFYAFLSLVFIVLTHKFLLALFRGQDDIRSHWYQGCKDFVQGLIVGSRNMIGIGVATATAGIVVGTVTLTGIGQVMIELVEYLSAGNIIFMLILTAVICIILGMGLPTTANYIVVSALMAPVIVELSAQNGLVIPLIAVHLFVFYFGILADDTPPVGLAAFAASAIARSDPIKTGIQGFIYDMRTAILPFMFLFNTQLLLIGIDNIWELLINIILAIGAMLVFAAATQGFWLIKNKWWENLLLLLIAFSLFQTNFWLDKIIPPYKNHSGNQVFQIIEDRPLANEIRIRIKGENFHGKIIEKTVVLPIDNEGTARQRLVKSGVSISFQDDKAIFDNVAIGSIADQLGIGYNWEIMHIEIKTERFHKHWFAIPPLLLLLLMGVYQRRRMKL